MAGKNEANILISVKDGFSKAFSDLDKQFVKISKSLATIGKGMTIVGGAITGFMGASIVAAADAEKNIAQVEAIIKTLSDETLVKMGGSTDIAMEKIMAFGKSLQQLAGVSDEEAARGLAKLTQITGDFTKAKEAAALATELSIYKEIDFATAVDVVGKVYAGNLGILGRYGIVLDENATKEDAIRMLFERTSGSAKAYGETMQGQTKIMKENLGDLMEEIGNVLIPVLKDALDAIKPVIQSIMDWIEKNPELTKQIILWTAGIGALMVALGPLLMALPGLVALITSLGVVIAALFSPIGIIIAALVALGLVIYEIIYDWENFKTTLIAVWQALGEAVLYWFGAMMEGVQRIMSNMMMIIKTIWDAIGKAVMLSVQGIINWLQGAWNTIMNAANTGFTAIKNIITGIWQAIGNAVLAVIDTIVGAFNGMIGSINNAIGKINTFIGKAKSAIGLSKGSKSIFDPLGWVGLSQGGIVPQYFAGGGQPRGMDTVPAMLSPGELILNKAQQKSLANNMGNSITIDFTGANFYGDDKRFAEKIGDLITQKLKYNIKYIS